MKELFIFLTIPLLGWRHFDDDNSTKIKAEKVISPDAYVLVYRLRGSQNIMKIDRCPSLHSSSTSSLHSENHQTKRKRSDQVSGTKTNSIDKRSVSENSFNQVKRSISMDSNSDTESKSNTSRQKTDTLELRRCASAVPATRPRVKIDVKSRLSSESATDIKSGCGEFKIETTSLSNSSSDEFLESQDFAPSAEDLGESFCESFEDLNVEQGELEKSLHDVAWVDSEDYFENGDDLIDNEIKKCDNELNEETIKVKSTNQQCNEASNQSSNKDQQQDIKDQLSNELSDGGLNGKTSIGSFDEIFMKDISDIDENDLD